MEFKGTNENWRVNSAFKKEVNNDKGVAIADCSQSKMIDDVEKEANAKLISKAPEMLKLLNDMYDYYSDNERITGSLRDFMIKTRQLIKESTEI